MEREVRLLSGEVVRYRDDNPSWWLAATGGEPLGAFVSETPICGHYERIAFKGHKKPVGEPTVLDAYCLKETAEPPYTSAHRPQNEFMDDNGIDYTREPPVRPL